MSSTNKTTNLGLNDWIGSDRSKREDFSEDNKKIDEWVGKANEKFDNAIYKASVANNCETTEEGFIADARQLTYLKGLIMEINNTNNFVTNLNDISPKIINKYDGSTLNTPYTQGLTTATVGICLNFFDGALQVAFPYKMNGIYMRYDRGNWSKLV